MRPVPLSAVARPTLWGAVAVGLMGPAGMLAAQGAAQGLVPVRSERERAARTQEIPREFVPPAGMCRIWVDGVPPTQQPAPTDCATAVRNKPANGRVIYGDERPASPVQKVRELLRGDSRPAERKAPPLVPPELSAAEAARRERAREAFEQKRITDEQLFGDRAAGGSGGGVPQGLGGAPIGAPGSVGGSYVTPGGAVIPGAVNDPRYFSGTRPPGTGSSVCLDRDGDGWCDDQRFGPPTCLDQDKDGRCDDLPGLASQPYPQVLPLMRSALDVVQGTASPEVMQWLGTNEFVVRIPEQGRGGVPWRALFLDARGELLQTWTDSNRDGRADRVEIFRNGERVKLIQR